MKTLHLTLKKKWYDMVESDEKLEEYRELTAYWFMRLVFQSRKVIAYNGWRVANDFNVGLLIKDPLSMKMIGFVPFDEVKFTNGYSKASPTTTKKCGGIRIGEGKPEWGAEPGKQYFIISLSA
jgi:hypothetical protein